jgi:hypothetical protein
MMMIICFFFTAISIHFPKRKRHDGIQVAISDKTILTTNNGAEEDDPDLQPLGIKQWRLQKLLLYQTAEASRISVTF